MYCPNCRQKRYVKNGFMAGHQRYKCKNCGCNFTKEIKHAYSLRVKKKVLEYYRSGMGYREIARKMKISHTTVMNWLKSVSLEMKRELYPIFGGSSSNLYRVCKFIKENKIIIDNPSWIRMIPPQYTNLLISLFK